jgi:hypothetical protein
MSKSRSVAKSITTRTVKSRKLKVISVCSVCGEPVCATAKDNAYRHGFNRHKLAMSCPFKKFSQEDGEPCSGSGQAVVYKRKTKK